MKTILYGSVAILLFGCTVAAAGDRDCYPAEDKQWQHFVPDAEFALPNERYVPGCHDMYVTYYTPAWFMDRIDIFTGVASTHVEIVTGSVPSDVDE